MDFGKTDREIMDYLMTSDFSDNFTPDESRFLLSKFRYQYRFLHAQSQQTSYKMDEKDVKIEQLTRAIEDMSNRILKLENDKQIYKDRIDKDLSIGERFFGKINFKHEDS